MEKLHTTLELLYALHGLLPEIQLKIYEYGWSEHFRDNVWTCETDSFFLGWLNWSLFHYRDYLRSYPDRGLLSPDASVLKQIESTEQLEWECI